MKNVDAVTPPIGTVVQLPHVDSHTKGVVVGHAWSEALGEIVRVRTRNNASHSGTEHLVYGSVLTNLLRTVWSPIST